MHGQNHIKSQGFKCGLLGGQHVSAMFSSVDRPIQRRGIALISVVWQKAHT